MEKNTAAHDPYTAGQPIGAQPPQRFRTVAELDAYLKCEPPAKRVATPARWVRPTLEQFKSHARRFGSACALEMAATYLSESELRELGTYMAKLREEPPNEHWRSRAAQARQYLPAEAAEAVAA
jgi:hypothetical protein